MAERPNAVLKYGKPLNPTRTVFGKMLRDYRYQRGLTQTALSELTGIDRSYIGRLESGHRPHNGQAKIAVLVRGLALNSKEASYLYTAANLMYNDEQASLDLLVQHELTARGYRQEVVEHVDKFWKTLVEMADQMQSALGGQVT